MKLKSLLIACLLSSLSFSALADRIITDQLDRKVTIPDHIIKKNKLSH